MKLPLSWTLNKLVVGLLLVTFFGLMMDLRYEHVDKVRHYWEAWIPIVYSGAMVGLGLLCMHAWTRGGRQILRGAFAVAFVVGAIGFWLHNGGHLISAFTQELAAWTQPVHLAKAPPQVAPLAFVGLGVLGMLACADRWQFALTPHCPDVVVKD